LTANVFRIQPKEGWRPKTGDQRAVPISPVAREVMQSLSRRFGWVVTMPPTAQHRSPGRQWTERRLLSELKRVLKKLKLPGKLHTFRHAFISDALLKHIDAPTLRKWVGHVDEEVIETYTHVHVNASQLAMQRLSVANLRRSEEPSRPENVVREIAQIQHTDMEAENEHDGK
jgi:integrase